MPDQPVIDVLLHATHRQAKVLELMLDAVLVHALDETDIGLLRRVEAAVGISDLPRSTNNNMSVKRHVALS
jgi:hypothetical protein